MRTGRSDCSEAEGISLPDPACSALHKVLVGALRSTIDAHGAITKDWIGSAAKRIIGQLKNMNVNDRNKQLLVSLLTDRTEMSEDEADVFIDAICCLASNEAGKELREVMVETALEKNKGMQFPDPSSQ